MAPPVSRATYLADMVALREQIINLESAGTIDDAVTRGTPLHKAMAKIAEKILMSIATLEDKTETLEMTSAQATPVERKRKSLVESKCIGNMKTLGSDKAEFRVWNDKFINAIAQTLGTPWRKYMRNLNRKLDQDRKPLTSDELGKIEGAEEVDDRCEASEGLSRVMRHCE